MAGVPAGWVVGTRPASCSSSWWSDLAGNALNPQALVTLTTAPPLGNPCAPRTPLLGKQYGPYRIVSILGAGGMGEVYRAHDTKLGRDVAIKALPVEFARDPERVARFLREARTLASVNHAIARSSMAWKNQAKWIAWS